jgi:hypothetical protein
MRWQRKQTLILRYMLEYTQERSSQYAKVWRSPYLKFSATFTPKITLYTIITSKKMKFRYKRLSVECRRKKNRNTAYKQLPGLMGCYFNVVVYGPFGLLLRPAWQSTIRVHGIDESSFRVPALWRRQLSSATYPLYGAATTFHRECRTRILASSSSW